MNLNQLGNSLWYFHVIDEFIHFSNAVIIHTKSSNIISSHVDIIFYHLSRYSQIMEVSLSHNILLTYEKTLTLILKQHQSSLLGQMDLLQKSSRNHSNFYFYLN